MAKKPAADEKAREEVSAALNGQQDQTPPTHIAITVETFKDTIELLHTLPYGQVDKLVTKLRQSAPIHLRAE